jgi:hypothetical protein
MSALDGIITKLDRAEYHLDALATDIREVMEKHGERGVTQHNPIDQTYSFLHQAPALPDDWGVRLGDFVHNLRSALDHLVAQFVVLAGATVHDSHQFPIIDHPNEWKRRVVQPAQNSRRGLLDFIDPQHIAFIESLQPYQPATGLPTLQVIRRFSNADKHRLIHASRTYMTATPRISGALSIPVRIIDVSYPSPGTPLEDGTEIARFGAHVDIPAHPLSGAPLMPPDAQMNVRLDGNLTTAFGEPGKEDTRIRDFRACLDDARGIMVASATFFA